MIINRRFNILKHWLLGRRQGVGFFELVRHLLAPISKYKALPLIDQFKEEDDYLVVFFKNLSRPLYLPKTFSLSQLYQVVSEIFLPADWHYYEIDKTKIQPDDIVVDCGAAEGLFSLSVLDRCKKIYAIEPLPKFVWSLEKTFSNSPSVEVVPVAIGAKAGRVYMTDSGISSQISKTPTDISVSLMTIDELFVKQNKPMSYLKADLEGYEMDMLTGAKETIRLYRPKIAITTYHKPEHAMEIARFLKSIHSDYHILFKGIENRAGFPVMLHAW